MFLFLGGLTFLIFQLRNLFHTQDVYILIIVGNVVGLFVSTILFSKKSWLFTKVKIEEVWAARTLSYVGTIALSISLFSYVNIKYPINVEQKQYKIINKKLTEATTRSVDAYYLIVDTNAGEVELSVHHDDYKSFSEGDQYTVNEIQGYFDWIVIEPAK